MAIADADGEGMATDLTSGIVTPLWGVVGYARLASVLHARQKILP